MKHILFILSIICPFAICSQSNDTINNVLIDEIVAVQHDIMPVREMYGGGKFIVDFPDECPEDIKNSFQTACSLWEEVLPEVCNIRIKIELSERGARAPFSSIRITKYDTNDLFHEDMHSLNSQIKGALMAGYISGHNNQFKNSIPPDLLSEYDFIITYNMSLKNEVSFSTGLPDSQDKYDFVSIAMRDIAKGLGIYAEVRIDESSKLLMPAADKPNPFAKLVYEALGTGSLQTLQANAYKKGTQGELMVGPHFISSNGKYDSIRLYAPQAWDYDKSLNTFIPESGKKLTQLLSYDFGRGSVIRDINDKDIRFFFRNYLLWDYKQTSSFATSQATTGDNSVVMPYKGTAIEVPVAISQSSVASVTEENIPYLVQQHSETANNIDIEEMLDSCYIYSPFYLPGLPRNNGEEGLTLSVQKKDGTWDVVYKDLSLVMIEIGLEPFLPAHSFKYSDLAFHYAPEKYARTYDGYLRARLTICDRRYDNMVRRDVYDNYVTYFAIDELPQIPTVKYEGIVRTNMSAYAYDPYDYFADIRIGIGNIAGAKRVEVHQLNEGDRVPLIIDVPDFEKGYFTATVDKEIYTDFTVIYYNDNGFVTSETITIDPIEPYIGLYNVELSDNTIKIKSADERISSKRLLKSYSIQALDVIGNSIKENLSGDIDSDNCEIDIRNLSPGIYVLKYIDERNRESVYKFCRQ